MIARRAAPLLVAAVAAVAPGPARATPLFLGDVDLDAPAPLPPPPWTVTLSLTGVRPEMLTELEARHGPLRLDGDRVAFRLQGYAPLPAPPSAEDRESGFWVDPAEPDVAALRPEVEAAAGPRPRVRDLEAFVAGFITRKDLSRRFDPASVVARRRQGDCSEHAVLLAAVARLFGLPSRVVTGFVVLRRGDGAPLAAAHAWAEVYEAGRWVAADATELDEGAPVRVPIWTLGGTGPGIPLADRTRLTFLHVTAVAIRPLAAR